MYRLLIADGDSAVRKSIQGLLDWESYGFGQMMEAATHEEAAHLAIEWKPHIMMIGVGRDDRDGLDLVRHLRAMGSEAVLCVLSESADPACIRGALQAGAQDYLLKPLNAGYLQVFMEKTMASLSRFSEETASRQETDPILRLKNSAFSRHTNKLLRMIRSDYMNAPVTLQGFAERLHMNSKYLGRVFLQETGMKFSEYLLAYRMEEAKRLIVNTSDKVSTIASMVGYPQTNRFYVHFKGYFGLSPNELRRFEARPSGSDSPKGREQ